MGRVWGNEREYRTTGKFTICRRVQEVMLVPA